MYWEHFDTAARYKQDKKVMFKTCIAVNKLLNLTLKGNAWLRKVEHCEIIQPLINKASHKMITKHVSL